MKLFFQLLFLLLTRLKASDTNMLHQDTKKEIVLKPIDALEIRFYLVEEISLELWLFLINKHSPTEKFILNKQFKFKRELLRKIKVIQVCDLISMKLDLFIVKTHDHFKVNIMCFTYFGLTSIKNFTKYFFKNIGLDAVYYGEKLEQLKNSLFSIYSEETICDSFLEESKTNELKSAREKDSCNIFR